ncbi:hypothetical protein IJM86_03925 [bacterium]|nr:hypothetical protein [bacterium]
MQNQGIMDEYTSPFINEKRGDIMTMLQYSYNTESVAAKKCYADGGTI